jgi:hypothetical protein
MAEVVDRKSGGRRASEPDDNNLPSLEHSLIAKFDAAMSGADSTQVALEFPVGKEVYDRYPLGSSVEVRYAKADPSIAILGADIDSIDLNPIDSSQSTDTDAAMLKEIRTWGIFSLGLGTIHLLISGVLSAPWGILLIVVGLASFYFREAAMFVVYSVVLAWAGISNISSGQTAWIAFAIVQLILAVNLARKFARYRAAYVKDIQDEGDSAGIDQTPSRADELFPWAGCIFGGVSLAGLVVVVVGAVIYGAATEDGSVPRVLELLEELFVIFGVLGVGVGLAALLSGFGRRILPIGGIVAGALVLVFEVVLALFV